MTTWRITESNGTFRVHRNRLPLPEEHGSVDDALKRVNVNKAPGDRVVQVAEDGYETPLKRKHWRGTGK